MARYVKVRDVDEQGKSATHWVLASELSASSGATASMDLEVATPATGDGIETEFVFTGIPVMPMRNGVPYSPTAFTVLGTTVIITVPPPDGEITALTR